MVTKLPWRELRRWARSGEGLAGLALAGCLLWACWPALIALWELWGSEPQYSHGYLVPLFACYLLVSRRRQDPAPSAGPSWWGLGLLAVGLAQLFVGSYLCSRSLRAAAILPCCAGVCVLFSGLRSLRWAWPGLAFLLFMLPLPYRLETALTRPLQKIATLASTYALQTLGFPAFSEGNVIRIGQVHLGVVEACSGQSMLITFLAVSTAVALLLRRPLLDRLLVLASAVPNALLANIIRITVTGVLYKLVNSELADVVFHDVAGWLMMPLALLFLWAQLRLLSWLLVKPGRGVEASSWALAYALRPKAAATAAPGPQQRALEPCLLSDKSPGKD